MEGCGILIVEGAWSLGDCEEDSYHTNRSSWFGILWEKGDQGPKSDPRSYEGSFDSSCGREDNSQCYVQSSSGLVPKWQHEQEVDFEKQHHRCPNVEDG